jgi:cytochrome c oxidase assembly protein subunit 15
MSAMTTSSAVDTRRSRGPRSREGHPESRRALGNFARLTAASTLFLIFAGGMVTSTGSGLAVPDWPLSYGMIMPPMVGGIFYEHGHRMIASFVGFLTLVQFFWVLRSEPRSRIRTLSAVALAAVITQGLLGGLTVIYLLPIAVSVSHACLAQAFFCLTVVLANVLGPSWESRPTSPERDLWRTPAWAAGAVYLQLVLGALMRHMGAGLAIPDVPLAFGRLIPPLEDPGVIVHFAHRVWGVVVFLVVVEVARRLVFDARVPRTIRALAGLAGVAVFAQLGLGLLVVLSGKQPHLTSIHVANGALVLGLLVWTATRLTPGDFARS